VLFTTTGLRREQWGRCEELGAPELAVPRVIPVLDEIPLLGRVRGLRSVEEVAGGNGAQRPRPR